MRRRSTGSCWTFESVEERGSANLHNERQIIGPFSLSLSLSSRALSARIGPLFVPHQPASAKRQAHSRTLTPNNKLGRLQSRLVVTDLCDKICPAYPPPPTSSRPRSPRTRRRDNHTACKRKLQRIEGWLAVLDELISGGNDKGIGTNLPEALVKAEADVTQRHEELAALLEQTDNGDFLRAGGTIGMWRPACASSCARTTCFGSTYRPFRRRPPRRVSAGSRRKARRSGWRRRRRPSPRCRAASTLLEIGFRLPAIADIEEQRNGWQDEKRETDKALHSLDKAIQK